MLHLIWLKIHPLFGALGAFAVALSLRLMKTGRLVELGLTVRTPARPVNKPGRRLRAQELATNAIEKIVDSAAPPEERAQRRRQLTKGPSEFREDRVDLPKAKGK
jgi:hypothetical protein